MAVTKLMDDAGVGRFEPFFKNFLFIISEHCQVIFNSINLFQVLKSYWGVVEFFFKYMKNVEMNLS